MHPACASHAVREAAAAGRVGEVIRLVRRAHGLNQRQLGAATGRSQSTISRIERGGSGTRDVETLRRPVLAHLRMATRMQAGIGDPVSATAMAAAVSEVAGLAGWLHWDMHDLGSARRSYRTAVEHAQRAGDSLLTGYMLGSLASFVVHEGEASEGLALTRHAATVSTGQRPATADAWLSKGATTGGDSPTTRRGHLLASLRSQLPACAVHLVPGRRRSPHHPGGRKPQQRSLACA
jgi:transcriptional regulator with XRE-family HTH domain